MSIQSRPVQSRPVTSGTIAPVPSTTTSPEPRIASGSGVAKAKRVHAPSVMAPEDAAPRVERWLYFVIAAAVVMVIGFFVPSVALRPTIAVAIALMAIGLLMLTLQSWQTRGEG